MSDRVVKTSFGREDLFSFATELFEGSPHRPVGVCEPPTTPRWGSWQDLARGLLFVIPAVSLALVARVLHLGLPRWALPLALTLGWGFAQALAGCAAALRNRGLDPAPGVLPSLLITVGAGLTASLVGTVLWGGGPSVVVTVVTFCLYVASVGVLSLYEEFLLLAAVLVPSLTASVIYLSDPSDRAVGRALVAAVGVTVAIALVVALRHARPTVWPRLGLVAHERRAVWTCFVYGICCGLAVSLVTVAAGSGRGHSLLFPVAIPVMLSLGVLEWQLHSFRARAAEALRTSAAVAEFETRAAGNLFRSTGTYVVVLVATSAVVAVVEGGRQLPVTSLWAEDAVGVALFAGMVAAICSELRRGLYSWLAGGGAFVATILAVHLLGWAHGTDAVRAASVAASSVAMLSMLWGAWRAVRVPFHYQS